jgi:RNA polymerase sigma factor (TIGR02999 family)
MDESLPSAPEPDPDPPDPETPAWIGPDEPGSLEDRLAEESVGDFTRLIRDGVDKNRDRLLRMVFVQLRRMAQKKKFTFPGDSIQATELINLAYLQLDQRGYLDWKSRRHFLWLAGRAMHDVCIARLRKRLTQRRGGDYQIVSLDSVCQLSGKNEEEILMLSDALSRLSRVDKWAASIVELRFFVGLTGDEIARELGVSPSTVDRRWAFGKAWLLRELG